MIIERINLLLNYIWLYTYTFRHHNLYIFLYTIINIFTPKDVICLIHG